MLAMNSEVKVSVQWVNDHWEMLLRNDDHQSENIYDCNNVNRDDNWCKLNGIF